MTRPFLAADKISPRAHEIVSNLHADVVTEVANAVAKDPIVVVGMAQNPYCKKARKQLESEGIAFTYLEYGSYFSKWRQRLAIKLWAGFPTFPMVFVNGVLIGGNSELEKLRAEGGLKK
ncbi:MAG: glutaredoxin [Polyangiaceae bacterium]|nr:glutaredoxin [Polyangiaceae bacterium]